MSDLVLTYDQAAELLECSADFVGDLVRDHAIPFVQLGPRKKVIPRLALERWLDEQAQKSQVTPRPSAGTP